MATKTTSEPDLATATREAREARELVEVLRDRVRDGDTTVDPATLAASTQLAEFADLRAEAAARREDRLREEARQARLAEVVQKLIERADDVPRLRELIAGIDAAVHAFASACEERDPVLTEARRVLHETGVPEVRQDGWGSNGHRGLGWSSQNGGVVVVDRWVRPIQPGPIVAAVVAIAAASHGGMPYAGSKTLTGLSTSDPYQLLESQVK